MTPRRSPIRRLIGVQMIGTGSYLPDIVVTNEDLASLGCDADWIVQRTGIRARRHAPADIATSDMAVVAAQRAIDAAAIDRDEIDLLVLATMSPDHLLPATATSVQSRLGLNCSAVDVSAACAGFMYALVTGAQYVATGCSQCALIVGADTNSRVTNPSDKKTYPLFGDGAGAVLLCKGSEEQSMLAFTLGSDGSGTDLLYRPLGGARQPLAQQEPDLDAWYMNMEGRSVFKWAVRMIEDSSRDILNAADRSSDEVDLWLLHQANERILDAAVDNIGLERDRVIMHLDRYGNTSTASVPIALDEAIRAGRIRRGDHLLLCGFGGGLSWGTVLWRW